MASLTQADLIRIVEAGESDRVEFKETLSGDATTRIREAICAFANDLPDYDTPGLVLVGVKDDGTICDFSVTDRVLQTLADMKTDGNIVPPPSMTVEKRTLQGRELALITVQPSTSERVPAVGQPLHRMKGSSTKDVSTEIAHSTFIRFLSLP